MARASRILYFIFVSQRIVDKLAEFGFCLPNSAMEFTVILYALNIFGI